MKKLTLFLLTAVLGAAFTLSATPPDRNWFTDFGKAQAEAREKNLPMFLLFTGSDWCPWCVKLHKDTLATSKFKSFVKDKVVLVYLDYPRRLKLPEKTVAQNQKLRKEYGIKGYPTIIVTNPEGQEIGKLGYAKVNEFLPRLQQVLDTQKSAAPAAGEEKSEYLTDFKEAQKLAREKKLPIVALFTGSDWCRWCVKLHKESLSTKEFKDYAAKDAVFLYLDFPRRTQLPAALKKQNDELAGRYKVSGFPTTVVMNADGRELGRIGGFLPVADYLKELKAAAAKK